MLFSCTKGSFRGPFPTHLWRQIAVSLLHVAKICPRPHSHSPPTHTPSLSHTHTHTHTHTHIAWYYILNFEFGSGRMCSSTIQQTAFSSVPEKLHNGSREGLKFDFKVQTVGPNVRTVFTALTVNLSTKNCRWSCFSSTYTNESDFFINWTVFMFWQLRYILIQICNNYWYKLHFA